nr:MAG TPA: hypothetical protein [Caudoviricetes sp.]
MSNISILYKNIIILFLYYHYINNYITIKSN